MKNTDNQYLFDKLNDKFDRDLDRLKDSYDREAKMLMYGDASGLNMTKRRNRLWMWFDRKTRYRLLPKVLIFTIAILTIVDATLYALQIYWKIDYIGPIEFGAVCILLNLVIPALMIVLQGVYRNIDGYTGDYVYTAQDLCRRYPTVCDPAYKDLECNAYHRPKDD